MPELYLSSSRAKLVYGSHSKGAASACGYQAFNSVSQYLSVSAFAREVGCSQDEILRLLTENRLKFYQLEGGEPFIPKVEMAKAKDMASRAQSVTDTKEEHILQNEQDRVSRAASRARVAAERSEQEAKLEKRKSRLSSKRMSR